MQHSKKCLICSKAGSLQVIKDTDRITSSHTDGEVNIIRHFFISTKKNQAEWQVTKECALDLAKQASSGEYDFMVSPELINTPLNKGGGGHYFGTDTYDDLIQGYRNHSHGKIVSVSQPYSFNDGTDDIFIMANTKLRDSKAASALMEHGAGTWTPFAVSPHIYPLEYDNSGRVSKARLVGVALVIKGAYGDDAVITKSCTGGESFCTKSLSASICCDKEDSLAATTINGIVMNGSPDSSLLQKPLGKDIMQEQVLAKKSDAQKEDAEEIEAKLEKGFTKISTKELETLKKQVADGEKNAGEIERLTNKDKTKTLNEIFKSVEDEEKRKGLVEKFFDHDSDKLHDFVVAYEKNVVEPRIAALTKKSEDKEEKDSKSAAITSLRKEPRAEDEKSEAASIVPKDSSVGIDFDSIMRSNV